MLIEWHWMITLMKHCEMTHLLEKNIWQHALLTMLTNMPQVTIGKWPFKQNTSICGPFFCWWLCSVDHSNKGTAIFFFLIQMIEIIVCCWKPKKLVSTTNMLTMIKMQCVCTQKHNNQPNCSKCQSNSVKSSCHWSVMWWHVC